MKRFATFTALGLLCFAPGVLAQDSAKKPQQDWPIYGGGPENTHYSSLTQINRGNVKQLQVAWSFDTGEPGGLQTSPIVVDGVLYGITPTPRRRHRETFVEVRLRH